MKNTSLRILLMLVHYTGTCTCSFDIILYVYFLSIDTACYTMDDVLSFNKVLFVGVFDCEPYLFQQEKYLCQRHSPPLVIVKDQSSHLACLNILCAKKEKTCENLNSIVRRKLRDNYGRKNTVLFQMLYFGTSKSNSEISKSDFD